MKRALILLHSLIAVAIIMIASSCEDNSVGLDAESLTFDQIKTNSRMTWFAPIYDEYQPDTATISRIKTLYQANPTYIVVFGIQSYCSCTPVMKYFPKIIKTLHSAGIADSSMNLLVMQTTAYTQPYNAIYPLHELPDCMWMKDGKVIAGRLGDTLRSIEKNFPDSTIQVEKVMLGLMQKVSA